MPIEAYSGGKSAMVTTVMPFESSFNFDSICRLCLSSDKNLADIFNDEPVASSHEWTLVDKILDCTSLQVLKDDGFPSQICPDCSTLIEALHNFKRKCISSDLTLREYIQKQDPDFEVTHNNCKGSNLEIVFKETLHLKLAHSFEKK